MPSTGGVCSDLFPRHGIAVGVRTDQLIELAPTRSNTAVPAMAVCLIPFMIVGAVPAKCPTSLQILNWASKTGPQPCEYPSAFVVHDQYERKRTLAAEASTETCGSGAFGSATQPWPSCNLTNFNMHYDWPTCTVYTTQFMSSRPIYGDACFRCNEPHPSPPPQKAALLYRQFRRLP